jgi:hypothetical protein
MATTSIMPEETAQIYYLSREGGSSGGGEEDNLEKEVCIYSTCTYVVTPGYPLIIKGSGK